MVCMRSNLPKSGFVLAALRSTSTRRAWRTTLERGRRFHGLLLLDFRSTGLARARNGALLLTRLALVLFEVLKRHAELGFLVEV